MPEVVNSGERQSADDASGSIVRTMSVSATDATGNREGHMESSADHVRRDSAKDQHVQAAGAEWNQAFDATAELYAKSELEERLRRIDLSIEKAKKAV